MGTTIRNEISPKKAYYLNKHRYLELKHFCMQYPIWKKAYDSLWNLQSRSVIELLEKIPKKARASSPVEIIAEARDEFLSKMELIEKATILTDDLVAPWILKCVTEGLSYDKLYARDPVPCSRSKFYILYRKFFWTLGKLRN